MSTESATSPQIAWEELNACQIRSALHGIEPPGWRRLAILLQCALPQLRHTVQAATDWTEAHLYQFETGRLRYCDPELLNHDRFDVDTLAIDPSAMRFCARAFLTREGATFVCVCDAGDAWRHPMKMEEIAGKPVPMTPSYRQDNRGQ